MSSFFREKREKIDWLLRSLWQERKTDGNFFVILFVYLYWRANGRMYFIFCFVFSAGGVLEVSQHHHRYERCYYSQVIYIEMMLTRTFFLFAGLFTGPKHDGDYLGRQCCSLSPVHRCQTACLRAKQYSEDLASECRKSDNMQLFQCLNLIRVRKSIFSMHWRFD